MKILITAGPTREPIDPVRYLSNRSSGRMGFALAEAAVKAGHEVLLIAGPTVLATPHKVQRVNIETAAQMHSAVQQHLGAFDAAVFAAAVADYRPVEVAAQKLKKQADTLTLQLERTPDILGSARTEFGFKGVLVGFAAETENLLANATDKLRRKRCDLMVANDVSLPGIGFDSENNAVTLCFAVGGTIEVPQMSKLEVAQRIIEAIEGIATTGH